MKKLILSIALFLPLASFAQDCMIGEVKMFAGNFAPRNWALLDGRILPINQNTALFSILGTQFGGDGRTTFALPDMRGRSPIGAGQGPGLSNYRIGQRVGAEQTSLNVNHMPVGMGGNANFVGLTYDGTEVRIMPERGNRGVAIPLAIETNVNANINLSGGGLPVENRQPSLTINHIICLMGIYPSRS